MVILESLGSCMVRIGIHLTANLYGLYGLMVQEDMVSVKNFSGRPVKTSLLILRPNIMPYGLKA